MDRERGEREARWDLRHQRYRLGHKMGHMGHWVTADAKKLSHMSRLEKVSSHAQI